MFFPSPWKLVKVVVIGKSNNLDYSTLSSYRPISFVIKLMISNLAKLVEKVIIVHVIWYSLSLLISFFESGFEEKK